MRVVPLALITLGVFGVLKHYGLIDPAYAQLLWPLLLIGMGLVMLARGPRWRADMHDRLQDRWERRMHRHFGAGWTRLSEEERERFRAGMRQSHGGLGGVSCSPAADSAGAPSRSNIQSPSPGEQR